MVLELGWFRQSVFIQDKWQGVRRVSNCAEAEKALRAWPTKGQDNYKEARQALRVAQKKFLDRIETERARDAFEKAAADAQVLVKENT